MIIGISLPKDVQVKVEDDKVLIIFNEKKTKTDLWKADFSMWLTEGDFFNKNHIDYRVLEVTNKDKFFFR